LRSVAEDLSIRDKRFSRPPDAVLPMRPNNVGYGVDFASMYRANALPNYGKGLTSLDATDECDCYGCESLHPLTRHFDLR